jgi:GR25 family glycosyltransferase involved in LPS biosynthesis
LACFFRDRKIFLNSTVTTKPSVALVIHLDRAKKRQKNVQEVFLALTKIADTKSISKHTINAIDGQKLTDKEIQMIYQKNLFKPHVPDHVQISKNVIACFLSQRKAWQHIVDQNYKSG